MFHLAFFYFKAGDTSLGVNVLFILSSLKAEKEVPPVESNFFLTQPFLT